MSSRLDRSPVAIWWRTIDRWFLAAFLSLMGLGILLSFAASPAVAERIGLDSFHFATRQIVFMMPALAAMLAVSFLNPRQVRRRFMENNISLADGPSKREMGSKETSSRW